MNLTYPFTPAVVVILIILTAVSILFSLSETSIIGLSRIRLRHMIDRGVRRAKNIQRLIFKLDKVIAAILIGNNIVNIAISAIVTGILVQLFGYKWGVIAATFITTFCILIICEITPKLLAAKRTEKTALLTSPFMEFMCVLLHPLVVFFIGISNFILKPFGLKPGHKPPLITEEELRTMIEVSKEEGVLTEEEKRMLQRILEFGDTMVRDVMMPKDKMISVDVKTGAEQILDIFVEQGHARLPVYRDSPDNIIGVVFARDLLYILRDKSLFVLEDLTRPIEKAPADTKVNDLLRKFQAEKIQIAVVVNEKQKAMGLVTLEDLIEEIVGEIEESSPAIKRKNKGDGSLSR